MYHVESFPLHAAPRHVFANQRTDTAWKGKLNFGKIVSIDLDGVVFEYKGWQGPDIFGRVVDGAAEGIARLRNSGWYVILFTTRLVTTKLVIYLADNGVQYDDINGRVVWKKWRNRTVGLDEVHKFVRLQRYGRSTVDYRPYLSRWFWKHNPECASIKPIASVYVDDMNFENGGRQYDAKMWDRLVKTLETRNYNDGE